MDSAISTSCRLNAFDCEQGRLDALEEDLIVKRCLGGGAKRNCDVHEVWVLGCPLEGLSTAHGPTNNGTEVRYTQFLCGKLVLGSNVVIE